MKQIFRLHKDTRWLEEVARTRKKLYQITRDFFDQQGFLEVETPIVVPHAGADIFTRAFDLKDDLGSLISSPEFSMKKLIGSGFRKIYTLTKCFRRGEITRFHNPEFSMLEWYEPYTDYNHLFKVTEKYFKTVFEYFYPEGIILKDRETRFNDFRRFRLDELFIEHAGFSFEMTPEYSEIKRIATDNLDIDCSNLDDWNEVFSRIFLEKIEPALKKFDVPVAVFDFPASLSSLSKLSEDGKSCQRFEIYLDGIELCNGFTELNDGIEQSKRFEENSLKIDHDLIDALNSGFPECSGIAVGLDRLLYFCMPDARKLSDVILFPADVNV